MRRSLAPSQRVLTNDIIRSRSPVSPFSVMCNRRWCFVFVCCNNVRFIQQLLWYSKLRSNSNDSSNHTCTDGMIILYTDTYDLRMQVYTTLCHILWSYEWKWKIHIRIQTLIQCIENMPIISDVWNGWWYEWGRWRGLSHIASPAVWVPLYTWRSEQTI